MKLGDLFLATFLVFVFCLGLKALMVAFDAGMVMQ